MRRGLAKGYYISLKNNRNINLRSGLAQSEKNEHRQNYRLEVCVGKETYSIFYEGPGPGDWTGIDIYDAYLETVKFNLYMVKFGLQEKLLASIEEDVGNLSSTTNNNVTLDLPDICNMFLLCFSLKYKSYETGYFIYFLYRNFFDGQLSHYIAII